MKKEVINETPARILKVSTCSTLSGRSELTYHLGSTTDGEIQFRIVSNSGNGQFNSDWVALTAIEKLLSQHPLDEPMTSRTMQPLFRGKSSNSPAFLFAVLKAEGLVTAGKEKDGGYLLGDIDAFKKEASALIAADTDLDAATDTPPESVKKKRPAKETV